MIYLSIWLAIIAIYTMTISRTMGSQDSRAGSTNGFIMGTNSALLKGWPRPTDETKKRLYEVFNIHFVENLDALPLAGRVVNTPYPYYFFPDSKGSIYAAKHNNISAVATYVKTFNDKVFAKFVNQTNGRPSFESKKSCKTDKDCEKNEECLIGDDGTGKINGKCAPIWSGICDGGATSTIINAGYQPKCDVIYKEQHFTPTILNALMTFGYSNASLVNLGEQCLVSHVQGATIRAKQNFTSPCMGIHPITLFLTLANVIGRQNVSFGLNANVDAEVWNYAAHSYEANIIGSWAVDNLPATYTGTRQLCEGTTKVIEYNLTMYTVDGSKSPNLDYIPKYVIEQRFLVPRNYHFFLEQNAEKIPICGAYLGDSIDNHPSTIWGGDNTNVTDPVKKKLIDNLKPFIKASAECITEAKLNSTFNVIAYSSTPHAAPILPIKSR